MTRRRVLVTGSSRGIGKAIALAFAEAGYDVAVNATKLSRLTEVSSAIRGMGREALEVEGDVSNAADVKRIFKKIEENFGTLDVLVNNAGVQNRYPVDRMPENEWDKVIDVNLKGAFLCIKEAVRLMQNSDNPSIINITSVHETLPKPHYVHYSASKAALGMMTRTLALELADRGIRVNAIAPGAMATDMNRELLENKQKLQEVVDMIPLGRLGEPEEVAYVAVFLASDKAKYITGTTIYVDGGLRLCNQLTREP